jgi:hypothetical protein
MITKFHHRRHKTCHCTLFWASFPKPHSHVPQDWTRPESPSNSHAASSSLNYLVPSFLSPCARLLFYTSRGVLPSIPYACPGSESHSGCLFAPAEVLLYVPNSKPEISRLVAVSNRSIIGLSKTWKSPPKRVPILLQADA